MKLVMNEKAGAFARSMLAGAVALAGVVVATTAADATTYVGTRAVGTMTTQFSITTDDTLGVLTADNILDWDIVLTYSGGTKTLNGPDNSLVQVGGNALSATATDLVFDFSHPGNNYLMFQLQEADDIRSSWCVQSNFCFDNNGGEEIINIGMNFDNFQRIPQIGSQVLGSVEAPGETPIPGALPLFVSGLGAMGVLAYRRKKKAQVA